jgi:hypothetical protein
VLKITIFKPNGDPFKTIKNPIVYTTEGPLLTATFTPPNGTETSIRTTLPFLLEENASEETTGFKADVWS